MIENKIAIFGVIFIGLGLALLFILFFWLLKRARLPEKESEKRSYGGLIRFVIFFVSILFIFLAWLFFQMQNYLRPFSEWIHPGQVLSSEKFVGEIGAELADDSLLTLSFYSIGKEGKTYKETFEVSGNNKLRLKAEVLNWEKWLEFFGFIDGYKLTILEVFSSDSLKEGIKTFKLSGGPTEIWDKIYYLKKFLPMVKPEKLKSDIFILNSGERKKVYIKDKKIVVE